jgi:cell division protein FtsI/penicillin-binding protein 2
VTPLLEVRPAGGPRRAKTNDSAILLRRTRRRQIVLFLLVCLALVSAAGRLVYWQVAQGAALAARANAEHLRTLRIAAGRGSILDSNGRVLALDVTKDTVIIDPALLRQLGTQDQATARLADLLDLPLDLVKRQIEVPGAYVRLADADGQPLLLTPDQSHSVSDAIAGGELAGVALYPLVLRVYPEGSTASQLLGFVRASDGVGQYGVEQAYDGMLAGQPGLLTTAVDAAGDPLADGSQSWTPPVPGANVTLTLDAVGQDMAERELADAVASTGASGGTVIVLDLHTGAILALANTPAFDPNDYAAAPLSAFTDPAVSEFYDSGSVMKAVTMAAGIDAGVITPDTSFYDAGSVQVAGATLHNWNSIAWGQETMTQVLAHSANVGAVWVEQRLGQAQFESYLARFGFGVRTGVDLPDEAAGLVPRPSGASEEELTLAEQSFGESIGVTPLQMAAAYGALANGGVLMRPYIVQCVTADGGLGARTCVQPQAVRRVVSAATAATVTQMLAQSDQYGEAQMHLVTGYSVAAKTGTATPDPSHPTLTYASVIGYAPASNPRFVILFKLDHPRTTIFGGLAAGPFWRSLAEQLFIYYRVPPDEPVGSG